MYEGRDIYSENLVLDHLSSASKLANTAIFAPPLLIFPLGPIYQQPLLDDQFVYSEIQEIASGLTVTLPLQCDHLTSVTRAHLHPAS